MEKTIIVPVQSLVFESWRGSFEKSGCTPWSKSVTASSDFHELRNALCLRLPLWTAKTVLEHCPKSLVQTFDFLLQ